MELPRVGQAVLACKAFSITLSCLTIALASDSIYTHFFMSIICLCLIFSVASLTCELIQVVRDHKIFTWADIGYHVIISMLLLFSAIHCIVKIDEFSRSLGQTWLKAEVRTAEAITAASFGIVQSLLCIGLAILIWKHWVKRSVKIG